MSSSAGSLRDQYRSMLKAPEVEEVLDLVVYRPLAFGLVKLLAPTRVTPNQVTFVSLVLGVAAGACYWQGRPGWLLAGAVLLFTTNFVDCADGMLARVRGGGSLTGYLFDGLVDYTTNTAVLIGMLHALHVEGRSTAFIWLVGVPGGLSYAWWCAMVDRIRNEWLGRVYGKRRDPAVELAEMREAAKAFAPGTHRWDRLLIGAYGLYVRMWYSNHVSKAAQGCCQVPPDDWRRACRTVMQAAVLMGPTMQLSLMMLAGATDRLAWYFMFSLAFGTAWGLAVLAWREGVHRRLAAAHNGG
ncbi:MAG TPA: CDP-alcohol phosphatidyltransferase family protein [Candidatus Krumholzibacteria bacterium]|nr:CDP-alcohol phosphatidyltransferase family protein [Candidatus Krumholzibacteria bacterium]